MEGLPTRFFLPDRRTSTIKVFIGPPLFSPVEDRGPVDFPMSVWVRGPLKDSSQMSLKLMPGRSHTIQISQNSWKNMNIFLTNSCLNFKPPRNPLLKLDNTVTHLTLHKLRSHWHGSLWLSAMQRRTGRDWHSHWTCWMPQGSVCRIWCSQLLSDYQAD